MKKFLSIIIPCYNSSSFITRCLNCLDSQTSKDFEVIFIDDGSKDNTLEIINGYKYDNKKIYNVNHNGPAEARNIGIKAASGKYIWFIDSDDVFESNAVELIVKLLKESNADILRFRSSINNNGNIYLCDAPYISGVYEGKQLIEMKRYAVGFADARSFYLCIHIYKRELIKNIPLLSEKEFLSECNSFNQRVYPKINKLQVIDDVLYQYIIREGSASFVHKPILYNTLNLFRVLKCYFVSLGIYNEYKDMIAFCVVDTLMLGLCVPNVGAFITEYSYCSNINVAHKRVQDVLDTEEFQELINEAINLKTNILIEKAHSILIKKDEKVLFEFLISLINKNSN